MAQVKTIARKYAKGLYEACAASDLIVARELLTELAKTVTAHPSVLLAIKNPAISEADKAAVLVALAEKVSVKVTRLQGEASAVVSNQICNLMRILVQNHRAAALVEVAASFDEIVARHLKMSRIQISSARALDGHEKAGYVSALRQQLGPQTEVQFSVEEELLGGMQIKAGDILIDGSVRTSLHQLRTALLD